MSPALRVKRNAGRAEEGGIGYVEETAVGSVFISAL